MLYKGKIYQSVIIPNPVGSGMVQIYDQVSGVAKLDAGVTCAVVQKSLNLAPYNTTAVPEAVQKAFLNGSMFGWDVSGADPVNCEGVETRGAAGLEIAHVQGNFVAKHGADGTVLLKGHLIKGGWDKIVQAIKDNVPDGKGKMVDK